jgi:transposase
MQQFIYDEYDELEVSIGCIRYLLDRERWTRKATQDRALERSAPLRQAWQGIQKTWDEDQLVFLDESGANERTGDRKYGWSPIGVTCAQSRPVKRSERWSILPALSVDGYLDHIIYQGSITANLFVEFVEERVLPHCTPYPGPCSVLILDNASIHKDLRLHQLCNDAGVVLKFLPPYSLDYNPIEATFKDLKAWIKRNYLLAEDFENFGDFLDFAVRQACGGNVRGHFQEAGYIVGG